MVVNIQDKVWFVRPCDVVGWRWRQQGPPKRWYPTATLHSVTTL